MTDPAAGVLLGILAGLGVVMLNASLVSRFLRMVAGALRRAADYLDGA